MRERFPQEGDVGYAETWAERFAKDPYVYADKQTTRELNKIMTLDNDKLNSRINKLHPTDAKYRPAELGRDVVLRG